VATSTGWNMVCRDGLVQSCLEVVPVGANVASRDRPVQSCPEAVPIGAWLECKKELPGGGARWSGTWSPGTYPIQSCLEMVPVGASVASRDRPIQSCPEALPVGAWLECAQEHQYDVVPE
jgi:hypothetical protein